MTDYKIPNPEESVKALGIKGIHEYANILPLVDQQEFQELCDSIAEKGLEKELTLNHEGLLLDGRHRAMACYVTGKKIKYIKRDESQKDDDLDYVRRTNVNRRQLTKSQKAMVMMKFADIGNKYKEEAKERQRKAAIETNMKREKDVSNNSETLVSTVDTIVKNEKESKDHANKTRDRMAKDIGVANSYISTANSILNQGRKDVVDAIIQGKATMFEGKEYIRETKDIEEAPSIDLWKQEKEFKKKVEAEKKKMDAERKRKEEKERLAEERRKAKAEETTFKQSISIVEFPNLSWEPITGCKNNCEYCYAKDNNNIFKIQPDFSELIFHENRLNETVNTKDKEDNIVLVCPSTDLFADWMPEEWIKKVIEAMNNNVSWNYMLLTKNPKRYLQFIEQIPQTAFIGATATNQEQYDNATEVFSQIKTDHIKYIAFEPINEVIDCSKGMPFNWCIVGARHAVRGCSQLQPKWEWIKHIIIESEKNGIQMYFKNSVITKPKEIPK